MTPTHSQQTTVGEQAEQHPVFGPGPIAVISGENPVFPGPGTEAGHEKMGQAIEKMGLKGEPTRGKYGSPEATWIVHNPSIPQLQELGKRFGQESVTVRMNGKNFWLYTNGDHEGHVTKPAAGYQTFAQEPDDLFTALPGKEGQPNSFFKLNIDTDSPKVPLHQLDRHLSAVTPEVAADSVIKSVVESYHEILVSLRKRELAKSETEMASSPAQCVKQEQIMKDTRVFDLMRSRLNLSKSEKKCVLPSAAQIKEPVKAEGSGGDITKKGLKKEEIPGAAPSAAPAKPKGIPKAPKPPKAPGAAPTMHKGAMPFAAEKAAKDKMAAGTPASGKADVAAPVMPAKVDAQSFRPASPGAAGASVAAPKKLKSPAMLKNIRK